jgi:hypothetical protein
MAPAGTSNLATMIATVPAETSNPATMIHMDPQTRRAVTDRTTKTHRAGTLMAAPTRSLATVKMTIPLPAADMEDKRSPATAKTTIHLPEVDTADKRNPATAKTMIHLPEVDTADKRNPATVKTTTRLLHRAAATVVDALLVTTTMTIRMAHPTRNLLVSVAVTRTMTPTDLQIKRAAMVKTMIPPHLPAVDMDLRTKRPAMGKMMTLHPVVDMVPSNLVAVAAATTMTLMVQEVVNRVVMILTAQVVVSRVDVNRAVMIHTAAETKADGEIATTIKHWKAVDDDTFSIPWR